MKNIIKIFALIMVLAMVFCMAACNNENPENTTEGGSSNATTAPSTTATEPSSEPTDDGMKTYTVTLKDSEGNPLAGVMVQICNEHGCNPAKTDADGVATVRLLEKSGYYAYVSSDEDNTKVILQDGQYDVTIVWDPAVEE